MKKILSIIILSLLFSVSAYSNENAMLKFNQYLKNFGYDVEEVDICKEFKKNSKRWFDAKCETFPKGRNILRNKLDIKIYSERKSEIPYKKIQTETLFYFILFIIP